MKIGVLTTSYPSSDADPSGHFVRGFCEWLRRHVGEVEVLALDGPADPVQAMRQGGIATQLGAGRALLAAQVSARLLWSTVHRASGWDAVVSHWLVPCAAVAALAARHRYHLAIAHGSDVALLRRIPGGPALVRHLARTGDLVYVADSLRIPGAPGRVVPMPAEHPANALDDAERVRARHRWAVPEGARVALTMCRLVREKGVDRLLAALPPELHLVIAGEGPERAALEAQARPLGDRVRFVGARFGADKRSLFALADLLVVPSRTEGAPTVVAEARQLGVPILATRVGGLEAAVGQGGRCVPAAELAHALGSFHPSRRSLTLRGWEEVGPVLWRGPLRDASAAGRPDPLGLDVFRYASIRE